MCRKMWPRLEVQTTCITTLNYDWNSLALRSTTCVTVRWPQEPIWWEPLDHFTWNAIKSDLLAKYDDFRSSYTTTIFVTSTQVVYWNGTLAVYRPTIPKKILRLELKNEIWKSYKEDLFSSQAWSVCRDAISYAKYEIKFTRFAII